MNDRIEIPHLQSIVARQLRRWQSEQMADAERRRERPRLPRPWITISREPGAGGKALGALLAERLGYDFVDRSILDRMASAGHLDADGNSDRRKLRGHVDQRRDLACAVDIRGFILVGAGSSWRVSPSGKNRNLGPLALGGDHDEAYGVAAQSEWSWPEEPACGRIRRRASGLLKVSTNMPRKSPT